MEKALLMLAAAVKAVGAFLVAEGSAGQGGSAFNPSSPGAVTQGEMAINSNLWEMFRIYYAADVQAYADNTDWPAPPAASSGPTGVPGSPLAGMQLAQALITAIQSTPTVASAIATAVPAVAGLVTTIQNAGKQPASTPAPTAPATSTTLPAAAVSGS